MTITYLQCDLCGSKWDITCTPLSNAIKPGWAYNRQCLKEGRRKYIIKTGEPKGDGNIELNDLDICDKCYNAIDRFLFSLGKEEEDG